MPEANAHSWAQKFRRNVERDRRVRRELKRLRWSVLVVWECQTGAGCVDKLRGRLIEFLHRGVAP